jgi:hypothetical protein
MAVADINACHCQATVCASFSSWEQWLCGKPHFSPFRSLTAPPLETKVKQRRERIAKSLRSAGKKAPTT